MTIDSLTVPATSLPRGSPLAVASWALLIVWLGSSAACFWLMETGDWRPFGRADAALDAIDVPGVEEWYRSNSASTQAAGGHPRLTLVHLYNADCRCNRPVDPQLERLIEHFQPLGVEFFVVPSHALAASDVAPFNLPALSGHGTLAAAGVISSPAALIFDAHGRLIYYGPYSDSAWCGSTGTLVEPVLERALSGLVTVKRPRASRSCSCGW
jgi:hypothetical protein